MNGIRPNINDEDLLYGILSSALSRKEGELLIRDYCVINPEGYSFIINFYFPHGCSKLCFKDNTAIIYKPWINYADEHQILWLSTSVNVSDLYVIVESTESLKRKEDWGDVILLLKEDAFQRFTRVCPDYSSMAPHLNLGNIIRFCQSVKKNKVTIFIGAGVSQSLGLPSWKELLKRVYVLKNRTRTPPNMHNCSDIIFARHIMHNSASIIPFVHEALYESLTSDAPLPQSLLIDAICHLIKEVNIDSIITYNYDVLLERHLQLNSIKCYPIFRNIRNAVDCIPIYHVHGIISNSTDLPSSNSIIISEEDYHEMYSNPYLWSNVEQLHALSRNTCLFLGLSMTDPNLRRLIDAVYGIKAGSSPEKEHFAFLPMNDRDSDFITQNTLDSMGVNVLWYSPLDNSHKELPELIESLIKRITNTQSTNNF